jgi:hypothetical protein
MRKVYFRFLCSMICIWEGIVKLSILCYNKQKETINAKSKKTKIYQENKLLTQVNVHL